MFQTPNKKENDMSAPNRKQLGIVLADNTVEVVFQPYEAIPTKKKLLEFRTTNPIKAGDKSTGVCFTVVEIDNKIHTDLNQVVGEIVIDGEMLKFDLAEGSEIEIVLRIDENREILLLVYIPQIDFCIRERFNSWLVKHDPQKLQIKYDKYVYAVFDPPDTG